MTTTTSCDWRLGGYVVVDGRKRRWCHVHDRLWPMGQVHCSLGGPRTGRPTQPEGAMLEALERLDAKEGQVAAVLLALFTLFALYIGVLLFRGGA